MVMQAKSMAFGAGYGNDGGFWQIGADGKLHWVPPWDPEISKAFSVAAALENIAASITSTSVRTQIESAARALTAPHVHAVQRHLDGIGR
jgi:hypothetical protein